MKTDVYDEQEEQNLLFTDSVRHTEGLVASFYGKFPYPWQPYSFDYVEDPYYSTRMINQELGFWQDPLLPLENPAIWVAGCGTNQAVETALHFPNATVIGSDLSQPSLEIARATSAALSLKNLTLRQESINDGDYIDAFDYIICTGVIHHNANPEYALSKLMRALKPNGILELMVYNRYHRILTSAFQQGVRILNSGHGEPNYDTDLQVAKGLLNVVENDSWLRHLLSDVEHQHDAAIADALINPVEHSYTVHSLAQMADACGLRLAAPCLDVFDQIKDTYLWEILFDDPKLQQTYDALADLDRWQINNLVRFEKSPMLWFYLQRKDSSRLVPSMREIKNSFLKTVFRKNHAIQRNLLLSQDEIYHLSPKGTQIPIGKPHETVREIYQMVNGRQSMEDIFAFLHHSQTFSTVNLARLHLATPQFPFLTTV